MFEQFRPAIVLFILLTILTGGIYPLLVTGMSQLAFPGAANGSLIERDGKAVGSKLIGQAFSGPKYFWSRASGTSPYPYNASSSTGTNLGPTNPALADAVAARVKALRQADPGNSAAVPADLATSSASGLDPNISPAAAEYQVDRVARARNLAPQKVRDLVASYTEDRQWAILGEPRVNVLELNLALDALK
jgi:potassium-transporting ATPase KdpC subunit